MLRGKETHKPIRFDVEDDSVDDWDELYLGHKED